MNIAEAQTLCLQGNIPFYSYRLPGMREVHWGAQLQGEVAEFKEMRGQEEGFVIVPFRESPREPALFIRRDLAFVDECRGPHAADLLKQHRRGAVWNKGPLPGVSQAEYYRQVTAVIDILKRGEVSKMVLSRSIQVEAEALRLAPVWFERLAGRYPEAFVFLVSVPGVMTWMGASPEIFLRQDAKGMETMALAGTRACGTGGAWGEKETEEQQIVSRYIGDLLDGFGKWDVKGPFTRKAGKIEHLCTAFFHAGYLSREDADRIRKRLHPTPAVGGFPVRQALQYLEQTERYNRRYYAGYLGPVGNTDEFHWFVNLRCMEIFPQAVSLYVGGGITGLSQPRKEWEETELKSRTLLDILADV